MSANRGDGGAFAVFTTRVDGGRIEVLLVGEIDLQAVPSLDGCLDAEIGGPTARPIDVDVVLNAVTFIDSTGLLALVRLRETVRRRGGRFRLVAVPDNVRFVIDLAGLSGELDDGEGRDQ